MGLELLVVFFVGLLILKWVLRNVNWLYYEKMKLGNKMHELPPGDLGWPFIGNMCQFLTAFKSTNPETFISNFVTRFGHSGLYKVHMFGNPSIIVTTPEACRKVLTDDEAFKPGWPSATVNLIGKNSFVGISEEDHRWQRKLTAAPVNGHEALTVYMKYIEENVVNALEKWADMGQIELLTQLRKLTFRIIMYIFLSSESEDVMEALEREYTVLNYGVRAMAVNIPGFAYHNALKARKNLVAVLRAVVTERRERRSKDPSKGKKDMMDALMDAEDEYGRKLKDEEIIDVLIMYLNAGHESSGHITMWATIFLQKHPDVFEKAKAEQEEIVKNRLPDQKRLTLKEVRKMKYLDKVIDETLRLVTFSLMVFREAKKDVNGFTPKAGNFLPFGGGSRLCPGNDLAKLEISIFLHHFLLTYEFERDNPASPLMYLPHTRPKDNCVGRMRRVSTQNAKIGEI
ncbi:hypothetical protein BUALT_Bualt01G0185600 [Buddleja alternifolia]|uniref:Ent-kaurenoic acid oxidase n=1 Tax=Buddleja alternifolia TaxID=168488 RepID=A0AAV6Y983_9LAMI|nr:hypothetical protein BUALT_Bualt01G0185600 [Buddleja alternifolia]